VEGAVTVGVFFFCVLFWFVIRTVEELGKIFIDSNRQVAHRGK